MFLKNFFFQNFYCIKTGTDADWPYGSFSKAVMTCHCVVCINNNNNNNNNKMITLIIVITILTMVHVVRELRARVGRPQTS